jgi:hypothetical protein
MKSCQRLRRRSGIGGAQAVGGIGSSKTLELIAAKRSRRHGPPASDVAPIRSAPDVDNTRCRLVDALRARRRRRIQDRPPSIVRAKMPEVAYTSLYYPKIGPIFPVTNFIHYFRPASAGALSATTPLNNMALVPTLASWHEGKAPKRLDSCWNDMKRAGRRSVSTTATMECFKYWGVAKA